METNLIANFLEQIQKIEKLDSIEKKLDQLLSSPHVPGRISATDYIREQGITRQTFYNRAAKGLFTYEKIGGRNYIIRDSLKA
jgi:hypothetical protein